MDITNELKNINNDAKITVTFERTEGDMQTRWVTPMGILLSSSALAPFQEHQDIILPEDFEKSGKFSYLKFMGWPRCQEDKGPHKTYLLRIFNYSESVPANSGDFLPMSNSLYETIEENSKYLAELVTKICSSTPLPIDNETWQLFDYFEYSFRELIRNVPEHSKTGTVKVMAQVLPARGMIKVAVVDSGCGIWASIENLFLIVTVISTNQEHNGVRDDKEAITKALKPSITRSHQKRTQHSNKCWSNSGFGLYMLSELAKTAGGKFQIVSGDTVFEITKDTSQISACHKDTAVGISLKSDVLSI